MKKIKNEVSKTIHKNHLIDIYNSNLEFEKNLYKSINSELIGSWELQTTTKEIIEHKKEQIKRFVFKYSPKLLVIENNFSKTKNNYISIKLTYKKNTKTQKAISETLKYF